MRASSQPSLPMHPLTPTPREGTFRRLREDGRNRSMPGRVAKDWCCCLCYSRAVTAPLCPSASAMAIAGIDLRHRTTSAVLVTRLEPRSPDPTLGI